MSRQTLSMNSDWRFHDGDIELHNHNSVHARFKHPEWVKAGNNGLGFPKFDDSAWAMVNLPHDFVIERCEFSREEMSAVGFLKKGIVWYRKTFFVPKEDEGKRLFVKFDGVFRDCYVWLNGNYTGRHLGGYMGFEQELTEVIKYGEANTLLVKVDATEYEGWWYEGGGIYRDVWLVKTPSVRIADHGLFAKVTQISPEKKTAKVTVSVELDSNLTVSSSVSADISLLSPNGKVVAAAKVSGQVQGLETGILSCEFDLEDVSLWELKNTALYTAKATLSSGDELSVRFGIRSMEWNAEKGFLLNGVPTLLKGVCGHDDFAGVGTALTRPIVRYKIKRLMDMGCNAYRCSHNPPSLLFLEACDEMGMLVIDEHRLPGTADDMLDDYITLIKRDRNHPSVILWSMGNEEMVIHATKPGAAIFKKMMAIGKKYDDTREYLYAINCDYYRIIDRDTENGLVLNPVGVNYMVLRDMEAFDKVHKNHPERCLVSTEFSGIVTTRGFMQPYEEADNISDHGTTTCIFPDERYKNRATCYGLAYPKWGFTPEESWKMCMKYPFSTGIFLWTGFDYRGETFPFEWPNNISPYGVIDLCGIFKDWAYYLQSVWSEEDVLHIFPSWNLPVPEGKAVSVWCFTNCEEVELFLNGTSLGKKPCEALGHLEWEVPYERGTLSAVGYRDGKPVMEAKRVTSGNPAKVVIRADKTILKADGEDCAIIHVHTVDRDGNPVTDSELEIKFSAENAEIIGTGNGNMRSLEHDKEPRRKLFAGECIFIVRSTTNAGKITVSAGREWLEGATLELQAVACELPESVPSFDVVSGEVIKRMEFDGGF